MSYPSYPSGRSFAQSLPVAAFDNVIAKAGVNIMWQKAHSCPCSLATGSPDPNCITCNGRGIYWDAELGPYRLLLTRATITREFGEGGPEFKGEPQLTIPASAGNIWEDAADNDAFTVSDASMRFSSGLLQTTDEYLPYRKNVVVLAVAIYDTITAHQVTVLDPTQYTVNDVQVTLDASFPAGTPFMVEYQATPTYVAYSKAPMPLVRPFGGGIKYPRRLVVELMDVFLRNRGGGL